MNADELLEKITTTNADYARAHDGVARALRATTDDDLRRLYADALLNIEKNREDETAKIVAENEGWTTRAWQALVDGLEAAIAAIERMRDDVAHSATAPLFAEIERNVDRKASEFQAQLNAKLAPLQKKFESAETTQIVLSILSVALAGGALYMLATKRW